MFDADGFPERIFYEKSRCRQQKSMQNYPVCKVLKMVYCGRKQVVFKIELLSIYSRSTVLPAKSDCDIVFCLQLLSKTLTCTLHLS